jgi:uncharacterized protein YndB with AHSA1/START domain
MPPEAVVERNRVIHSSPDEIYEIAGNLRRFHEWSPWSALDPKTEYQVEGPELGTGQTLTWRSANPQVGAGKQTITEAVPGEKIVTEVDMGDMGKWTTIMTLVPVNETQTSVTWTFRAKLDGVLERWASVGFDRWVGADFQRGLGNLESLAEKEAGTGG